MSGGSGLKCFDQVSRDASEFLARDSRDDNEPENK